jgi:3-hydroxyacyl-CoA dehydrogenase
MATVTSSAQGRGAKREILRAAVVGTGTMGPGMGAVLARAGLSVALYDTSAEALERAQAGTQIADGVLDRLETPRVAGGGVRYSSDLGDAVKDADMVLEAVPEKLEIKHEVLAQLEGLVGSGTILASNTSGIPISRIAEGCAHPERVLGMHWSNPPHLIPMIEVIPGERTDPAVVEDAVALVERVGYEAVVEREVPGFVENRILYAIMREAVDLVDRGIVDADAMDRCVRWGIGYKLAVIGPMELLDMAGLDIYQAVSSYLNKDLSGATETSKTITDLTAEGRLGMKTGGGLYDYTPESIDRLRAERARKLVAVRKALSEEPK